MEAKPLYNEGSRVIFKLYLLLQSIFCSFQSYIRSIDDDDDDSDDDDSDDDDNDSDDDDVSDDDDDESDDDGDSDNDVSDDDVHMNLISILSLSLYREPDSVT